MAFVSAKVVEEGKAAKLAGEPASANPYPAGTQNGADWLEGYTYDVAEQNVDDARDDV